MAEFADRVTLQVQRGHQVFEISAATGEGLRPLGFAMAALVGGTVSFGTFRGRRAVSVVPAEPQE